MRQIAEVDAPTRRTWHQPGTALVYTGLPGIGGRRWAVEQSPGPRQANKARLSLEHPNNYDKRRVGLLSFTSCASRDAASAVDWVCPAQYYVPLVYTKYYTPEYLDVIFWRGVDHTRINKWEACFLFFLLVREIRPTQRSAKIQKRPQLV